MIPPSALTSVFNSAHVPLQRTLSVIEQGISEGLHTGAQLYVSQNGRPIADSAIGQNSPTRFSPGSPPANRWPSPLWPSSGSATSSTSTIQFPSTSRNSPPTARDASRSGIFSPTPAASAGLNSHPPAVGIRSFTASATPASSRDGSPVTRPAITPSPVGTFWPRSSNAISASPSRRPSAMKSSRRWA